MSKNRYIVRLLPHVLDARCTAATTSAGRTIKVRFAQGLAGLPVEPVVVDADTWFYARQAGSQLLQCSPTECDPECISAVTRPSEHAARPKGPRLSKKHARLRREKRSRT